MPTRNDLMYNSHKNGSFEQMVGNRLPETNLDAFGRLRISDPITLFDCQHQYDRQTLLWEEIIAGAASFNHNAAQSAVELITTTASGDAAIKQTKEYFRYQPGKSQLVLMTGVFGESHANNVQRMGYFDSNNGIYLEYANSTCYICRRSSANGTVVNERVAQSDWNIEQLDGQSTPISRGDTAYTGKLLDPTQAQIFLVDMEWLGVGRVRTGFVIDGAIYYTHEFLCANEQDTVYMETANLPIRYEIENTGTANAAIMRSICSTVISEGGVETNRGLPFSTNRGANTKIVSTREPLLSIRPNTEFQSKQNRSGFLIDDVDVIITTGTALIEVIYNGEVGNSSYSDVETNVSAMQVDIAANTVANGTVIASYYLSGTNQSRPNKAAQFKTRLPFTVNYYANTADVITVAATEVTGGPRLSASIGWREFR